MLFWSWDYLPFKIIWLVNKNFCKNSWKDSSAWNRSNNHKTSPPPNLISPGEAPPQTDEPFGLEAFRPRATRLELADKSQGRGAHDRLAAQIVCCFRRSPDSFHRDWMMDAIALQKNFGVNNICIGQRIKNAIQPILEIRNKGVIWIYRQSIKVNGTNFVLYFSHEAPFTGIPIQLVLRWASLSFFY